MVNTLPSNAGDASLMPGQGAKIPRASQPKNQNIKNRMFVTNTIKTLKVDHIKKKIFQKKKLVYFTR